MENYHPHILTPINMGKELIEKEEKFTGPLDALIQKCEQMLQQLKLEYPDNSDSSFVMKIYCEKCKTIQYITEGKIYNQFGNRLTSMMERRRFSVN